MEEACSSYCTARGALMIPSVMDDEAQSSFDFNIPSWLHSYSHILPSHDPEFLPKEKGPKLLLISTQENRR
jgi:hypothetical protein